MNLRCKGQGKEFTLNKLPKKLPIFQFVQTTMLSKGLNFKSTHTILDLDMKRMPQRNATQRQDM